MWLGLLVLVIIFVLYWWNSRTSRKLACASAKIAEAESNLLTLRDELDKTSAELAIMNEAAHLNKNCQRDRVELQAAHAHVENLRQQMETAAEQLEFYKTLAADLGKAVNKAPCGYGVLGYDQSKNYPTSVQLDSRCEDQRLIVAQLRGQLADRDARINGLLARQRQYVGMY